MAEEDLIFGKNRHFFGGIEPSNMLAFGVVVNDGVVNVTATLPNDTVVNNQTLCTVEGAIIRRKTTDYPKDEFDGDLVADIKESTVVIDSGASSTETYYYAAFPYTTQGVYNRNKANRTTTIIKNHYLYGYDLTVATASPSGRVTYPSDVDNAGFTPAAMDFSSGVFNYGSWNIEPGTEFMPRPCMLTYAGVVDRYLNPNDYTKKTDGSASSVANTSFGGNAMMEWPKIWTKRWEENGIYHFRCSDKQIDADYECWCNYDLNNNQIDHFYTSIYTGSNPSNTPKTLRSISGQTNFAGQTADPQFSYARANGDDWCIDVLADRLLIQDLLVMMAKSTDGQTAYGYGVYSNGTTIDQGTMNTKGMFWGSNDGTSGVKVFGMENMWGNQARRIAGWINEKGTQKVKLTRSTHDGSTATDYNTNGIGYLTVPDANISGSTGGYIKTMKTMPYGRIPYDLSGSATTYEADGVYFDNSQSNYAAVGSFSSNTTHGGIFSASLCYNTSYTGTTAALSCKPRATV